MKKILILLIGLVSLHAHAQTIEQMQKYMRFVPSNMKASDINPSDIPSEDILRQMGLSEKEISEAMDYKYQRGKYNPNFIDTSSTETSLIQSDLLYNSMSDSLFELNDSIIYPPAKIYGQDFLEIILFPSLLEPTIIKLRTIIFWLKMMNLLFLFGGLLNTVRLLL